MWKQLWKIWAVDKPAAFADLLWDVFVVQFAAFLDRLTVRQVIAFIPVLILVLTYTHSIPIPLELMLVGDLLAYIDIYSALFLLGVLSRVTTVLLIVKQAAGCAVRLAMILRGGLQRMDLRHRRESGTKSRKRLARRAKADDDGYAGIHGVAWA